MSNRYRILAALWFLQLVNYLDRVGLSFAGPTMMKEFGFGPRDFGLVLSSFAGGYLVAQLPGGLLADRWGARRLLVIAPIFWAIFTALLSLAHDLNALLTCRFLFGFSEGIANAACFKLIGDAFTARERPRASAIWLTSFAIAPAFAGPLVTGLISHVGWRWMFVCLALPALAVSVCNAVALPGRGADPVATPAEGAREQSFSLGVALRQPTLWALCAIYLCFSIAYWGYLGWVPTYLTKARHLNLKSLGAVGGVPYLFALLGLALAGWLGSGALHRWRIQLLSVLYACAGAAMVLAFQAHTLLGSMVGLSASAFFIYGSLSIFGAAMLDFAPERSRATYASVVTTAGQIGGLIAPAVIGALVGSSGAFASGFAFMIAALLIAALVALGLAISGVGKRISSAAAAA